MYFVLFCVINHQSQNSIAPRYSHGFVRYRSIWLKHLQNINISFNISNWCSFEQCQFCEFLAGLVQWILDRYMFARPKIPINGQLHKFSHSFSATQVPSTKNSRIFFCLAPKIPI